MWLQAFLNVESNDSPSYVTCPSPPFYSLAVSAFLKGKLWLPEDKQRPWKNGTIIKDAKVGELFAREIYTASVNNYRRCVHASAICHIPCIGMVFHKSSLCIRKVEKLILVATFCFFTRLHKSRRYTISFFFALCFGQSVITWRKNPLTRKHFSAY